jgi:hypothetical protein
MKTVLKIVVGLVLVIIIAGVIIWWRIDAIAARLIENAGTAALKVQTTVDSVHISLLGGSATLHGLQIANPEGYKSPHLMRFDNFSTSVNGGSLFSDTIEIPSITLDGLDVNLEQKGAQSNVKTVLNNLDSGGKSETTEAGGSSRKFKVDHVLITNTTAHVQVLPLGGQASTLNVKIDKIELNNLTSDNADGIAMNELVGRIIPAIFMAIGQKAGNLPGDFGQVLNGDAAQTLKQLGVSPDDLVKSTGEALKSATQKVQEAAGDKGEEVGKKISEGIGNLLNSDKKE